MNTSSNPQSESSQAEVSQNDRTASAENQPTGETLSRAAEEGIEPAKTPEDPAVEHDEMRRSADAGAGS